MLSRAGIIAGLVLLTANLGWQTARADTVRVPGTWYDQDKQHWPPLDEFSGFSWTWNYFHDKDYDGNYDPGEPCAEWLEQDSNHNFRPDAGENWPQFWYSASDSSCWMASGANLANYMGGGDWYQSWAYNPGLKIGSGPNARTKTFVNGGRPKEALETLGYSVLELEAKYHQWPEDPVQWIKGKLAAGAPVSIGVHPPNSPWHALTVYAINDATHQLTLADSDQDWSSGGDAPNFRKFTYNWNSNDRSFSLVNYNGRVTDINVAQCIDPTGQDNAWIGKGVVPGKTRNWSHRKNWSGTHAPLPNDTVWLAEGRPEVEIDVNAKCHRVVASSDSTITLGAGSSLRTTDDIRLGTTQGTAHTATFNQTGGRLRVGMSLYLGNSGTNSKGTYHQTGGIHDIKTNLIVGRAEDSEGVYTLEDGELWVGNCAQIGQGLADGKFTQSGGLHWVSKTLYIAALPAANKVPTYTISGGTLAADTINVGPDGHVGKFAISGADAEIAVFENLLFGEEAKFAAVENSKIHLVGAKFVNHSTTETELAGLANVELAFGLCEEIATFEVAGSDKGIDNGGFDNNFELGALTLGRIQDLDGPGLVALVDAIDNGNREAEGKAEALYAFLLAISEDSLLVLNHLNLYVQAADLAEGSVLDLFGGMFSVEGNLEDQIWGWINAGVVVDGWIPDPEFVVEYHADVDWTTVYAIPEPTPLALLGLGLLWIRGSRTLARRFRTTRHP